MPSATAPVPVNDSPAPVEGDGSTVARLESDALPEWEYRNQSRVVLYEALTARVGHRDALLWQSPSLALTAQAFLLTIALGHDSGPIARLLAALLGLCVTYLSIQLMLKHNMYMRNDQLTMVSLERTMEAPTSVIDHDTQVGYLRGDKSKPPLEPSLKKGLTRYASVHVWVWGLSFFALMNFLLLIFAAADMMGVPCLELPVVSGEPRCWVEL